MLDRKFIVENASLIQENCARRGVKCDVERLVQLETARRQKLQEVEELNRQANETQKRIGPAKDPAERETLKAAGRLLAGARYVRQLNRDETGSAQVEVHLVQLALGGSALVAFTDHGQPLGKVTAGRPVPDVVAELLVGPDTLPGWTGRLRVVDMLGAEEVLTGATVRVPLTFRPVYLQPAP